MTMFGVFGLLIYIWSPRVVSIPRSRSDISFRHKYFLTLRLLRKPPPAMGPRSTQLIRQTTHPKKRSLKESNQSQHFKGTSRELVKERYELIKKNNR